MASQFLKHIPCPDCGSSDGRALYADNSEYCFVCHTPYNDNKEGALMQADIAPANRKPVRPLAQHFNPLPDRAISRDTAAKYKVLCIQDKDDVFIHQYPYFKGNQHVANKYRARAEKKFIWEGEARGVELFGQSAFPAGSAKVVTIAEGECNTMACFELGGGFPSVGVTSSSAAVTDVKNNYEYLNSFQTIVIAFDIDTAKIDPKTGKEFFPGQEAAVKVAGMFAMGKVKILSLRELEPGKGVDPNDYLRAGALADYKKQWWAAPPFMPAGLRVGTELWDEIINRPSHYTVPYPFDGLNDKTYGVRLSELVLLTAETGAGKTSVFKEIEASMLLNEELKEKGYGVGFLHLEEPNYDTALGLMSIVASKPYHLPDTPRDTDELRTAYDTIINSDRVVLYDHFGSNSVDEVVNKIRHMSALGCKYIFLDHLTIVVSDQSGDERKQLDEISTKLKMLTMELNIAVLAVIHINRQGLIRGSAGPEQVANIVMQLFRDKEDPDEWRRNVTKIVIKKNRFCGRTGPACYLYYNEKTGRLIELDKDAVMLYEAGSKPLEEEVW